MTAWQRGSLVVAATMVLLGGQELAHQSTPALANHEGRAEAQALAERLLTPPFADTGTGPVQTRLVVGDVPTGIPSPFPVPPGGRLLGGVARTSGEQIVSADAALDAAGSPSEVHVFFDQALPEQGWTTAPQWESGPPAGLQSASPVETAAYCQSPSGPWIWLSMTPVAGGPTDVRVHLEPINPGPCAAPAVAAPGPASLDAVPALSAPAGAALIRTGGSADVHRSSAEGFVLTATSVADLEAHFAQQLQAAGWTRTGGQAQGPVAWSRWSLSQPGDWQGFLLVLEGPGQNRRVVYVRAESGAAPIGGS